MKKDSKSTTLNDAKVIHQLLANQVINLEKQLLVSEDKLKLLKRVIIRDATELRERSQKKPKVKNKGLDLSNLLVIEFFSLVHQIENEIKEIQKEIDQSVNDFNDNIISSEKARNKLEYLVPKERVIKNKFILLKEKILPTIFKNLDEMEELSKELKEYSDEKEQLNNDEFKKKLARLANLKQQLDPLLVTISNIITNFQNLKDSKNKIYEERDINKRIEVLASAYDRIRILSEEEHDFSSLGINNEMQERIIAEILPLVDNVIKELPQTVDSVLFKKKSSEKEKIRKKMRKKIQESEKSQITIKNIKDSIEKIEVDETPASDISSDSYADLSDIWSAIGAPIVSEDGVVYGLGWWGVEHKDTEYLGCIQDKIAAGNDIEELYTACGFDNKLEDPPEFSLDHFADFRKSISKTCGVPEELAFTPTILREYLGFKDIEGKNELKLQKKNFGFIPLNTIKLNSATGIVTCKDKPQDIKDKFWLKFKKTTAIGNVKGLSVIQWDRKNVGVIKDLVYHDKIGFLLLIACDSLNYNFIEKLISFKGLKGKKDKKMKKKSKRLQKEWFLRSTIQKYLDINESEVFLPENLWRFIWNLKLPMLPWEIWSSYLATVPFGSIRETKLHSRELYLIRRIEVKYILDTLKSPNVLEPTSGGSFMFVGFSPNRENELVSLYCPLFVDEVLKIMGFKFNKRTAKEDKAKLKLKIANTLEIKANESFLIINLLKYHLFDARKELSDINEATKYLVQKFHLKEFDLKSIKELKFLGLDE